MALTRPDEPMTSSACRWAAGLLLALAWSGGAQALQAQSWRTVTMSRQAGDDEELEVRVRYGAGRFRVAPADPGLLYRMQLRYDEEDFEPVADYRPGRLELGVESLGGSINLGRDEPGELDLKLGRDVPMELDLEFGAVRADLDLGGLSLQNLKLKTGAAEARIDVSEPNPLTMSRAEINVGAAEFTARSLGNLRARRIEVHAGVGDVHLDFTGDLPDEVDVTVDMALGALELRFPEGVGVRLEKDAFLTSVDAQEMVKRGENTWYSLDWDDADRRITVLVKAAFGGIDVSWAR